MAAVVEVYVNHVDVPGLVVEVTKVSDWIAQVSAFVEVEPSKGTFAFAALSFLDRRKPMGPRQPMDEQVPVEMPWNYQCILARESR